MSPYLTACTGMDALVHAIEAAASTANSPITDLHAFSAIKLIRENLQLVIHSSDNLDYRARMMLGSLEAGLAFSNASLGAVHAMAHSLGGLLDLPHGEANAILLNHVISFNYAEASERYDMIGAALGLKLAGRPAKDKLQMIVEDINMLKVSVGITATLGQRGAKKDDVRRLAENAMNDPCMVTNPRQPVQRDIEAVYEEAL